MAAFNNYSSILIGERAAGMGGAYTALTGDPAGCAFYNPASVARMEGTTLSAAVSIYTKTDAQFGTLDNLETAAMRVNRGTIVPLPASSGTVYAFGNFALGLSILFPDYEAYKGEVKASSNVISYMNYQDQSLWVGGTFALNVSDQDALGLTMYYTSRTFQRSVTDQLTQSSSVLLTTEEKAFSQNSVIYILGYYHQWNKNWSSGISSRLPSLPVDGQGSYFQSIIDTSSSITVPINRKNIHADTRIPPRVNGGIAYTQSGKGTLSLELTYHGHEAYTDMDDPEAGERIKHREIWNAALGGEYYLSSGLALRMGIYSNLSSHAPIKDIPVRQGDHLDMWGLSTNLAFLSSSHSTLTLGGYYSGGKGVSTQMIGQKITPIPKSMQIFAFLVGTSFQF